MRTCAISLLTLVALTLAGSRASADPIGPSCGTCQGSIYTLEYDGAPISTTATTETFRITLTIDTSGYVGNGSEVGTKLSAVAIKVSSMLSGMSLFSAPAGVTWSTWMGGLNANGCSNGGSGFECAYAGNNADGVPVPNLTPYSWVFDLTMDTGTLFTTPLSSSIKVRYIDDAGVKKGDLVSENITLQVIPEPTSAALVAFGLLGFALAGRRSR